MPTQTSTTGSACRKPREPPLQPPEPGSVLLEMIGDVKDEHILVLGSDGPDLMCALLRAGAAEVTHLNSNERLESDSATIAIVPSMPSLDWLARALPSIRHALLPTGRVILCAVAAADAIAANLIRRSLIQHGYSAIHTRRTRHYLTISAGVPAFGLRKAA